MSGAIKFTPDSGFTKDPTFIRYSVQDYQGTASSPSTVTVSYTQSCSVSPFTLVLDDPSTAGYEVIVADDSPIGTSTPWGLSNRTDANATTKGYISFTGAVGKFTSNRVTAKSKPLVGTNSEADISISSSHMSSAAGTVVVWATDTCFQLSAGDLTFTSPTGGTTNGTLSFQETVDLNNRPFATAGLANTYTNTLGPYPAGAFSGTKSTSFTSTGAPLSLTKKITVTHPAGTKLTTLSAGGTIALASAKDATPEPHSEPMAADLALADLTRTVWLPRDVDSDLANSAARCLPAATPVPAEKDAVSVGSQPAVTGVQPQPMTGGRITSFLHSKEEKRTSLKAEWVDLLLSELDGDWSSGGSGQDG